MTVIQKLDAIADTLASELPLLRGAIDGDSYGATFPSGYPAFKPFFHSNTGQWWYYDNIYWLTANKTWMNGSIAANSTGFQLISSGDGTNIYVTDVHMHIYINGTNNASNYWTIGLRSFNNSASLNANFHSFTTSSNSANAFFKGPSGPNITPMPAYTSFYEINFTTNGTPGALTCAYSIGYRRRG